MTEVNLAIVREYFEQLGYLVTQPCKYQASGRPKQAQEEADLLAVNPRVREHRLPNALVWTSAEFRSVARVLVAVRAWHTERIYASTLAQTPDLLRFAEADTLRIAADHLGSAAVARVLCLPRLPASEELKGKALETFRARGVDGIILFPSVLRELISVVDPHRNYEKSDLLQVIRILKIYGMLEQTQLELFVRRVRRRPRPARSRGEG